MRSGQGGSDVHATGPLVTVVVSPRECFSYARDSLASIFAHTQSPFSLVYVDGGSPRALKQHLEARAREAGFRLIRTEHYLSPNRARNLGLRHVTTKYVVFIDNDVIVTPRWLSALVECAEATGATIVSPLICEGEPAHTIVHCAGGECGVREEARGTGCDGSSSTGFTTRAVPSRSSRARRVPRGSRNSTACSCAWSFSSNSVGSTRRS